MRYWILFSSLMTLCVSSVAAERAIPKLTQPGNDGYVSGELIYPLVKKPTPQCHASTLAELPDGTLVAAWFGGTREKNPDVGIWFSRRGKEGWAKPQQLVDGSEGEKQDYACWNPVLFQPKTGSLMLFYKVGIDPRNWWGMLITSDDGGESWSKPRKLGTSEELGEANTNLIGPVKNKPIQLADGSILCPSSSEHDNWRVHFERSSDLGKTWEVIGPIHNGTKINAIQPSILTYADGSLQILCRTRENVVGQAWSKDGGETWSEVTATDLPNPNAGTDAVTLQDGRQLLVYNHTTRTSKPAGRQMLNVALSNDGKYWKPVLTLESSSGEYSYPAVIQTSDGKVHVSYTYRRQSVKHVVLDPSELK